MMNHYIHHTPGRLRLRFKQLKGRPDLAKHAEREIREVQGVTLAEANTVTGSLLIHYSTRDTDQSALLNAIDQIGKRLNLVLPSATSQDHARIHASSHDVGHSVRYEDRIVGKVLTMAIEKCIEHGATALLRVIF